MVRLREIPRTASFAWSPGSKLPFIATGTRAGAVDADFSNETCLELWNLGLDKPGSEPTAAAKISTDSGFHDLAWAEGEDDSQGVIAGALENGSLDLWDADKLLDGASDSLISRSSKHTGAIKALQFNPKHSNLLATGGAKGELFISDLNNLESPFRLGNTAARADDIECLDWNKKVSHIMVTGSSAGFVTVWDVKTKKESLTLNNLGRKAVSAVAWDPEKPTKLMTSIPLESEPLILVWDLRNSNAPERTLRGHDSGVLSLSWCAQDPDLLLSSGKDNRTICWNTQTGQPYGEFPVVTNWTFQTRWNPHNPNLFATASFDGKIAVQTIQNTSSEAAQVAASQNQALDGEDFFAKAQTQPQASTFSLPKAPKWLERPVSVSFGFGGRVVSTGLAEPGTPGSRSSKIRISTFEVDSKVSSATESFENSLKDGDLGTICETRIEGSQSEEEKADWRVIKTLISGNPRKELVNYLGFSDDTEEAADGLAKLGLDKEANGVPEDKPKPAAKRHKRLSSIFDGNADADGFLTDLAASKGATTNNPFQIYTGSESEADRRITRALLLGQFEKALSVCLEEDRMSDAFMIAICGGQKCIEKAQEAYFSKQAEGPNYLRLLASVVGKNLWDVVHNADLANWKEVMAALCTFADEKEFPDLCEALGDRLEEQVKSENNSEGRKEASFCYLAGSKLEKVVSTWIDELQENEKNGIENAVDDSSFSIHVRALQTLIEKVTIFRQVTNFQDQEKQKSSDWKLSLLYDKYLEYANVVATHGQLQIAEKYLDLLPEKHPEAEVARNRIKLATRKPAPKAPERQPAAASRLTPKPIPQATPFQPPTSFAPATQAPNPYGPPAASQPTGPYGNAPSTGYTPGGYQPPQHQTRPSAAAAPVQPPPQSFGAPPPGPPPRAQNEPTISSYTNATGLPAWNDLPEGFVKPPTSRRGTPSAGGGRIGSPFANQPNAGGPIPGQPPMSQQMSSPPPVAPPPKGPAPPPRMTPPPSAGPPQGYQAPETPSSAASLYGAPPAPASQGMHPPPVPRGPSPYNAPPSGPPPSNRYAPSPAAQSAGQPQSRGPMPPPPQASAAHPPPPSAYAPPQAQQMPPQNPYAPASPQQPMHQEAVQPPPPGPAPGSRPSTAQSQSKASPAPQKYPPGDRTHIPPNAQPIFEILSSDMERIKARAPASFKNHVKDADRRLNILFDHLNNEDLLKPNTIDSMVELAQHLQAKNYDAAHSIHLDILTNRTDECGNWMVGVKRLIAMSKATP